MIALGQFFREWITALPGEVWTALGALAIWGLTTLTNRMSNSHARRMLKVQLDHDSEERQREREYDIKCQVFLPAIEAGSHAMILLGHLCQADIDRDKVNADLAEASTKMAAASALASEESWIAVGKLQHAMGALQSELALARGPIELENLNLKYAREHAQIALREQEAANAEQRRVHGERGAQQSDFERVKRVLQSSSIYFRDMQRRQDEATQRLTIAMHYSFMLYLDRLSQLGELSISCIVALRTELGLSSNPTLMLESQQALLAQSRAEVNDAMAKLINITGEGSVAEGQPSH